MDFTKSRKKYFVIAHSLPPGLHTLPLFPPYHLFLSQRETFTSPINTGTSTSGPITVANAAGEAMPKTAMATAIASSKLLDAAENESEADFW